VARRRLAHLLRAHAAALTGRMQGCVLFSRLVGAVHRGSPPAKPVQCAYTAPAAKVDIVRLAFLLCKVPGFG
jgi:hypothetical protein